MIKEPTKRSVIEATVGRARLEVSRLIGALYGDGLDLSMEPGLGSKHERKSCWG